MCLAVKTSKLFEFFRQLSGIFGRFDPAHRHAPKPMVTGFAGVCWRLGSVLDWRKRAANTPVNPAIYQCFAGATDFGRAETDVAATGREGQVDMLRTFQANPAQKKNDSGFAWQQTESRFKRLSQLQKSFWGTPNSPCFCPGREPQTCEWFGFSSVFWRFTGPFFFLSRANSTAVSASSTASRSPRGNFPACLRRSRSERSLAGRRGGNSPFSQRRMPLSV